MNKAKLFQNGQSLAVRLPKEFRVKGKEVFIKKQGRMIVLIPINEDPWLEWVQSLSMFSADFLEDRKQPKVQKREPL
ncbi:MAG: antitoxin [Candidatus Berkiellales bacterium]